jgi:hypothetical protein
MSSDGKKYEVKIYSAVYLLFNQETCFELPAVDDWQRLKFFRAAKCKINI